MSELIATGHQPRTTDHVPNPEHSFDGDCAVCGQPADGLDARDGCPKCERHAAPAIVTGDAGP